MIRALAAAGAASTLAVAGVVGLLLLALDCPCGCTHDGHARTHAPMHGALTPVTGPGERAGQGLGRGLTAA